MPSKDRLLQDLHNVLRAKDQGLHLHHLQDGSKCRQKTVCYKTCKMVCEQRVKDVCTPPATGFANKRAFLTPTPPARWFKSGRTKTVCHTVCKPVCYQENHQGCKVVKTCVPYTYTRCVAKTICEEVPVTVSCDPAAKRKRNRGGLFNGRLRNLLQGLRLKGGCSSCAPSSS